MDRNPLVLIAAMAIIAYILVFLSSPLIQTESIQENEVVWEGNVLSIDSEISDSETYQIVAEDGSETTIESTNDGTIRIDSSQFSTGKYTIQHNERAIHTFEIKEQEFDVNPNGITITEDSESTSEITIDSNRNDYSVRFTNNQLTNDELSNLLHVDEAETDITTEIEDDTLILHNMSEDTIDLDYSAITTESSLLTLTVTDTKVRETVSINKYDTSVADDTSRFSSDLYQTYVGDPAQIRAVVGQYNTKEIQIGSDVYQHTVRVKDTNGDGTVVISFDTRKAGNNKKPVTAEYGTEIIEQNNDIETPGSIAPLNYNLYLRAENEIESSSTLSLQKRENINIQTYTIPGNQSLTTNKVDTDEATPTSSVANGDWLLIEVEASSIYSVVDEDIDLHKIQENNELAEEHGFYMNIVEKESSPNRELQEINLSDADLFEVDESENKFYVGFNTSDLPKQQNNLEQNTIGADIYNTLEIEFNRTAASPIVEERQLTDGFTKTVTLVERHFDISNPVDTSPRFESHYIVDRSNTAKLTARTTIAPNTVIQLYPDAQDYAIAPTVSRVTDEYEISHKLDTSVISESTYNIDVSYSTVDEEYTLRIEDIAPLVIEETNIPERVTQNETVTLSADIFDANSLDRDYTVEWIVSPGREPIKGEEIDYTYNSTGAYSPTVIVTDQFGYSTQVSQTIFVEEYVPTKPEIVISEIPKLVLVDELNTYNISVPNMNSNNVSVQWSTSDGNSGFSTRIRHKPPISGIYRIDVTATSSEGIVTQKEFRIQAQELSPLVKSAHFFA